MRKDAREFAFKMIFENLFPDCDEGLTYDTLLEQTSLSEEDVKFYNEIFSEYKSNKNDIEKIVKSACEGYQLERIYKVDLALMYLAITEIKYVKTPIAVAINEILNLSKKYSTEKSQSFINGVLAKVVKSV